MVNEENPTIECRQCYRLIVLGEDLLSLEEGVIGPRGVVPLDDVQPFCCGECLIAYLNGIEIHKLKRRIP